MAIGSGTKLGQYKVLAPIGAGGMGEVYLARDSKLDREVAIKVLPELFSRDKERLLRFEREAKVLASLNHPNIAAIYGFEEHQLEAGATHFLVMELIAGETLLQRVKNGPMPVEEALSIGKQIAEALEAAHDKGIIHRDLKPGNVMVKPDGTVKVLDFGLAKALAQDDRSQTEIASSPTITADFTRAGVILGTAAYMSPEQARGKPLDKRTDIWSFGVVLYECFGGGRPFNGETATDLIAKILEREPDWDALPSTVPPIVRVLLQRCLQKDRKDRLRDIGEAWVVLNGVLSGEVSGIALAPYEPKSRIPAWRRILPWAMVAALVIALGGVWLTRRPAPRPVMRFTVSVPEDQALAASRWPMFDISADGTRMVYVGRGAGASGRQLYLRHIHQLDAVPLPNTGTAFGPFFSPDGEWIAFAQQGKLKKISILGGPATTICEAASLRGGTWNADDTIVFAPTRQSGIWRVSAAGGEPEKLTDAGTGEGSPSHRWPAFLPGGKTVLFTATPSNDNYDDADIVALSLETSEQKVVLHGGTFARYVPTGHIVFARSGTLMAVPFDAKKLEVTGSPVPILEGIMGVSAMGSVQYGFSQNGTFLYLSGGAGGEEYLPVWVDRTAKAEPISQLGRAYIRLRISPDGGRIAAWILADSNHDIWILEIERDMLTRLTFDDAFDRNPVWSPDGRWIYFASDREGGVLNLFRKRADGTGDVERLTTSKNAQRSWSISPDGKMLAFEEQRPETDQDIMILSLDGEAEASVFISTPFVEMMPAISPDGKWIAYVSDESGEFGVYVRPFPNGGSRVKVSAGRGFLPKWSPDGSEIVYRLLNQFFTVSVSSEGASFRAKSAQLLFDLKGAAYRFWYDISSDGQRLLLARSGEEQEDYREPTVVVNWFDELRAKVPVGTK